MLFDVGHKIVNKAIISKSKSFHHFDHIFSTLNLLWFQRNVVFHASLKPLDSHKERKELVEQLQLTEKVAEHSSSDAKSDL